MFETRLYGRSEPVTSEAYIAETWNKRDGLPDTTLSKTVQTQKDGYLWVATFGGLVRFNGVEFQVYDKLSTANFPSPFVVNIHCDRMDRLWVSTDQGLGIFNYLEHRWQSFDTADGWLWPSEYARTISENRHGRILITTFQGRVVEYDGRQFHEMHPPGIQGKGYLGFVDEQDRWLLVQGDMVVVWDGMQWRKIALPEGWNSRLSGAGAAKGGGVWFLQGDRLFLWRQETIARIVRLPQEESSFWNLMEDNDGHLWLASFANGLTEITPKDEINHYSAAKGMLPSDSIRDVFEDTEGNHWICSNGGGLTRFKSSIFNIYGANIGLKEVNLTSVSQDLDGNLYLGSFGGGVYRYNPSVNKNAELMTPTASGNINCVLWDRRGRLWYGTYEHGAFCIENGKTTPMPEHEAGGAEVTCLYEDSQGRVWIGGKGVNMINGDTREYHPLSEFGGLTVHCFGQSDDGTLLAGGDKGLFRYRDGHFERYSFPGLDAVDDFCSLYRDADNYLWAGTLDGIIIRFKNNQAMVASSTNNIFRSRIGDFMEDANGYFWIPSNNGILKVNKRDLHEAAEGRLYRVPWSLYDEKDGMPTMVHANNLKPCSQRDSAGRFWVATEKGLVMIDPAKSHMQQQRECKVHVESVVFTHMNPVGASKPTAEPKFQRSYPIRDRLRIPPGEWAMELKYAGLLYNSPESLVYDLSIRGPRVNFTKYTTERSERFYNLDPGDYEIEIRAQNRDGQTGPFSRLEFTIGAFYWQTAWFQWGGASLLVVLFAGSIRYLSLAKYRRRMLEMEQEKQMGALRNRLATILENTSDFVAFTNSDRRVLYLNPAGRRLVGLNPSDELSDLNLANLFTDGARQLIEKTALPTAMDTGSWLGESALTHREGGEIPVSQLILTHRGPDDSIDFISTIIRDITPLKKAEESRLKLEQQLRQAQKMEAVGHLAGGIAHDFNNLLTIIKGNANMLESWAVQESEPSQLVREIDSAAERASALTSQLLAFGRKQMLRPARLDVNEAVAGTTRLLRRMIPESISIVLRCGHEPLHVLADATQLDQVLINLAVNARDAMPSGGELIVQTRRVRLTPDIALVNPPPAQPVDCAAISVIDTGCGISPEHSKRLFEPFFTTKDVGKGTGLGLATVFGIVCQHSGWIQVESQLGKGSTFLIYLPLAPDSAHSEPATTVSTAEKPAKPVTGVILLVEDERGVRLLIKRMLEKQGYTVHAAASGHEALQLWPSISGSIQVLITDVVMPGGVSGVQLAQQLRAQKASLKVILCSGYNQELVDEQSIIQPGVVYFQKPFQPEKVLETIRNFLDSANTSR